MEGQPETTAVVPMSPTLSTILNLVFYRFVCLAAKTTALQGQIRLKVEVEMLLALLLPALCLYIEFALMMAPMMTCFILHSERYK